MKPDRSPGSPERLDRDWNDATLARLPVSAKAVSSAPGGGRIVIDLGIAFVGEQEKIKAARKGDRPGKIRTVGNRPLRVGRRAEIEGDGAREQRLVNGIEAWQEAVFCSRPEERGASS